MQVPGGCEICFDAADFQGVGLYVFACRHTKVSSKEEYTKQVRDMLDCHFAYLVVKYAVAKQNNIIHLK